MDSNLINGGKKYSVNGFSILEMIIGLGLVYIVMLGLMNSATYTYEAVKMQQIRSYLLQIQAIQSRNWLNSGAYSPLSALPQANIDDVEITEVKNTENGFGLKLTINFMSEEAPCRTMAINEEGIFPRSCLY